MHRKLYEPIIQKFGNGLIFTENKPAFLKSQWLNLFHQGNSRLFWNF